LPDGEFKRDMEYGANAYTAFLNAGRYLCARHDPLGGIGIVTGVTKQRVHERSPSGSTARAASLAFDRSVLSRVRQSKYLPRRLDARNGHHGNGPRILIMDARLNRDASLNPGVNIYSGVRHNLIKRPMRVKHLLCDKASSQMSNPET
jgi:hypothetical protein